jgi:hypothetical protein
MNDRTIQTQAHILLLSSSVQSRVYSSILIFLTNAEHVRVLFEVSSYGHLRTLFQNSLEMTEKCHKTPQCSKYRAEIRTPFLSNKSRERYYHTNLDIKLL